ncbi:MAG: LysM peptidoglycan-binding domain-containing protein [Spirochaetaceae bacterium]|nr:LysM peptidoglycan-binding domain-containing protein [Spirochaetaceae bacterium]
MMMKLRKYLLLAFFLLAGGLMAFADNPVTHTLQKGETLYSISKKYNVPYEALAAANGISDPTKLKVGTVLIIPSVHMVTKGETLYGIARHYGISLNDLLASNKLSSSYVLKVGDILVIPAADPGPDTAATTTSTSGSAVAAPSATVPAAPAAAATTSTVPSASTTTTKVPALNQHASPSSSTVTTASPSPSTSPTTTSSSVPMPEPVKTQDRIVDMNLNWPATGKAMYLDGKIEGIMIRVKPGETAKAIAAGTVVSAGPSRGFSLVVFVQAKSGYVYVYGGNESLSVKTGDHVGSGNEIGKIGADSKDGSPIAYFFVFRNGQPIDPALAPRD